MHVVACTDSRGVGGAEISLANLVAEVDPAIRVDVLVECDDVDALAEALGRLRDDGRLRTALGAAGRERALASYTGGHMARADERLWAQECANPRTPRLWPPAPRP